MKTTRYISKTAVACVALSTLLVSGVNAQVFESAVIELTTDAIASRTTTELTTGLETDLKTDLTTELTTDRTTDAQTSVLTDGVDSLETSIKTDLTSTLETDISTGNNQTGPGDAIDKENAKANPTPVPYDPSCGYSYVWEAGDHSTSGNPTSSIEGLSFNFNQNIDELCFSYDWSETGAVDDIVTFTLTSGTLPGGGSTSASFVYDPANGTYGIYQGCFNTWTSNEDGMTQIVGESGFEDFDLAADGTGFSFCLDYSPVLDFGVDNGLTDWDVAPAEGFGLWLNHSGDGALTYDANGNITNYESNADDEAFEGYTDATKHDMVNPSGGTEVDCAPEPSSALLALFAGACAVLRRRRSQIVG